MATPEERLTDRTSRNWRPAPADALQLAQLTSSDSAPSNVLIFPSGGTSPVPTAKADKETEQRFRQLADQWLSETGMISDPIRRFMDRSHLKIIAMGEKVLPLVLKEVERMSGPWFVALDAISPVNPVTPEDQLSLERTARAWVEWGRHEGLI